MNERKGRGRYRLRGQGTHHQGGGELRVRQERRTLGPRRKAVQDGFAADIGLTNERRIKVGFTVVPESIRLMWKATDADIAAIPALVTSLIA